MKAAGNTAKNSGNGRARRNIRARVGIEKRPHAASAQPVKRWIGAHEVFAGFDVEWLNERVCTRWVLDRLMPYGPSCPRCGNPITRSRQTDSWYALRRVRCGQCGRFLTATSGTFLHGAGIDVREYLIIALLVGMGVDVSEIARLLGRSRDTIATWSLGIKAWGGKD